MRKKQELIFACKKCGKVQQTNKELSNENGNVYDNKPCVFCGGKTGIVVKENN